MGAHRYGLEANESQRGHKVSAVTMCERNEGGSSPSLPAKKRKKEKTMRRKNWAEMKAMNARLRCTGDNKERRYFTEPSEVSSTMDMKREVKCEPMYGRNPFRDGMVTRPQKGKTKNAYSREEAGTMGTQMTTRRFSGSYITVYCKSRKMY